MTAATAHAGYEVHGLGLPARSHCEVYHAVADQTVRAGYDAGPLCGLTRKAGERLCGTPVM
jgi:hypothetical protein